jgi:poly-gamma-glutamate capsule biosynthesis protein CapA/YwtB (metallophosphatase superfamily)
MAFSLALAGDTMLGRSVAGAIRSGRRPLLDPEVVALACGCDLFVLNLECCISDRGERWDVPGKPFFFRAPPAAAELLAAWGVDCVTLANNHALDYGVGALRDTLSHLAAAGVAWAGAGVDVVAARAPRRLTAGERSVAVIAATDHPADFAAGEDRPGVAYADLRRHAPGWLAETVTGARADVRLCSMHWGPNMACAPVRHVRFAAPALVRAGATLVVGHSAHIPHGAGPRVLYDLGDFIDDYAVDPDLRNDLGLVFLVRFDDDGGIEAEAVPLALEYCHTRLAGGADAALVRERFARGCEALGTRAEITGDRVRVRLA